jgi:hypothetical protein
MPVLRMTGLFALREPKQFAHAKKCYLYYFSGTFVNKQQMKDKSPDGPTCRTLPKPVI